MGRYRHAKPRPNAPKRTYSWNPQRLLQEQKHQGDYSRDDREDAIWLIDHGYHPLDVAIMLGMRVWKDPNTAGGTHSNIYQAYPAWVGRAERERLAADTTEGR